MVFAHVFSADSPARAIVRNLKQFNGKHSCDWCEFPGETIENGGAPTRYYPYRGPPVMRTAENQIRYGLDAVGNCGDVNNGNCTEWSAIWSEIKRVITKSICNHKFDFQNCTTRSAISTLLHSF